MGSGDEEDNALATGEVETSEVLPNEAAVTLTFKKKSELTAMQSALSQLLPQVCPSYPLWVVVCSFVMSACSVLPVK